jgi:hypothetical protein
MKAEAILVIPNNSLSSLETTVVPIMSSGG